MSSFGKVENLIIMKDRLTGKISERESQNIENVVSHANWIRSLSWIRFCYS